MAFEPLIPWLTIGIVVVIGAWLLARRWIDPGERLVRRVLRRGLGRRDYFSLHDLTLQTLDGTTQVDHVVVSRFGVFVIETKALTGWIFGSERSRRWTQVIFGNKRKFQNPLHQNYKHVKAIEGALGLSAGQVQSIVVFVGNGRFKTPMPPIVMKRRHLAPYIRSKTQVVLSDEQVENAVQVLERHLTTRETRRRHIDNLKQNAVSPVCPRCGSAMVIRTARRGRSAGARFWGCSAYPGCRATRPAP